ncbi:MAG: hypothetical protein U1A28_03585, partial [Patescibacteria group bacterium]|nr:hypothetical protein [Patescibacteria group bacterium]
KKKWSAGRRQESAKRVCETPHDEPWREVRPRAATRTECESVSRGARVTLRVMSVEEDKK